MNTESWKTIFRGMAILGSISAPLASRCDAAMIGQWTFEGTTADAVGNFGNLVLRGDASIVNGALDLNGNGTTPTGWASSPGSGTATLSSKTFVVWITLQSLGNNARNGSAMTLDSFTVDRFNGIVFGEKTLNNWMNGSNGWSRSPNGQFSNTAVSTETTTGEKIQLAVTYAVNGATTTVTGYRNGVLMGTFNTGVASWVAGEQEVIFGSRHTAPGTTNPTGALDALIHEARLYDTALTLSEIQGLTIIDNIDSDGDQLSDDWENEHVQNLTSLTGLLSGPGPGAGTGDLDGDGLTDLEEQSNATIPDMADSDGDGLNDKQELDGAGNRPPTLPMFADTDGDGLDDGEETNTGTYVSETDTGTDPTIADTDSDGLPDGWEVTIYHSNPLDSASPSFHDTLIGHWTFESGEELTDLKGNFPDLILHGDATVTDGVLTVSGAAKVPNGWANSDAGGVPLAGKTMVSWVTMQGLADVAKDGSAMSINSKTANKFDGIIFSEKALNNWMNGSNIWQRSPNNQFLNTAVSTETTTGNLVMLAITYQPLGSNVVQITGYRNGIEMGSYASANLEAFSEDEQQVVFGARHITSPDTQDPLGPGVGVGALSAKIHEARLYGRSATAEEIMELFTQGIQESGPLVVTAFSHDRGAGTADLSWISEVGKTYKLQYSNDLDIWQDIATGYPVGGATTTETTYQYQAIPATDLQGFFRVLSED